MCVQTCIHAGNFVNSMIGLNKVVFVLRRVCGHTLCAIDTGEIGGGVWPEMGEDVY